MGLLRFQFSRTLQIKLFFKPIHLKVAHFFNFTTACEMDHAVSIWHVLQSVSYIFFNWDEFVSLCFIVKVRTENFLESKCMVAMARVKMKLKIVCAWVSLCFLYELVQRCNKVIESWVSACGCWHCTFFKQFHILIAVTLRVAVERSFHCRQQTLWNILVRASQPCFKFCIILGIEVVLDTSLLFLPFKSDVLHKLVKQILSCQKDDVFRFDSHYFNHEV